MLVILQNLNRLFNSFLGYLLLMLLLIIYSSLRFLFLFLGVLVLINLFLGLIKKANLVKKKLK